MTEANTEVSNVPFDILTIYHSVKDYKVRRSAYDADLSRRKENGFTDIAVERAADNPNNIKIVFSVSDMSKAKSFASDPGLKRSNGKSWRHFKARYEILESFRIKFIESKSQCNPFRSRS
ncbi:MAG: hypothetical protein IPL55_18570 [Saprospiraceae bacterium]|nr:hypothetical protein [Saprospiraceae bacterium]